MYRTYIRGGTHQKEHKQVMTMSTTTIAGEQPITRLLFLLVLLFLLCTPQLLLVQSWSNNNFRRHLQRQRQTSSSSSYYYYSKKNDDNEEEKEEDWRDFRAKLVQQYRGDGEKITTTSSSSSSKNKKQQWAYESGDVIEKGSLIVSHPIQDFAYGGLRQQYFHKCVVLVLEHSAKFTKGIILNRPTKETMRDDLNVDWNVWFGGDVQGLDSDGEEFTCLHQLNTPLAQNLSQLVVKDMQVRI